MPEKIYLSELVVDPGKLARVASKKRHPYDFKSVERGSIEKYEKDGWVFFKKLKTKIKLKKDKAIDEIHENKVWHLMYLLGYPEINLDRNFKILIERKGAEPLQKQIDVFAKDDETVIVAECKASSRVRKRTLQKDIEEFANLKGPISRSIKKHYGPDFKPKIIWLFVTHNIIWSAPDRERAAGQNINIITERELRYYMQIADHLKAAARFQFLAEFLKGQKIPELDGVKVPAIRGKLGGKRFYSFISTPKQMLKISFVNHRSLNDPEGAPSYQRLVNRTRLRQISSFIHGGGFFPTNILINFVKKARFEKITSDDSNSVDFGNLHLPNTYRSAWVIDGQHRLYGFAPLPKESSSQNIMVVAFEELDKTEEANLFVTINHEQKTVPKTLLDDLEGELKWGSKVPTERIGAISARLIGFLNQDIGEPFYGRVTQQGIPATEKTCLTVPALKDGLRKSGLVGEAVMKRKEYQPGPLSGENDAGTLDRSRAVINTYFSLFATANASQWEKGRAGNLCNNVGIQGYFMLLAAVIKYMEDNKGLTARELDPQELITEIEEYIDPVTLLVSKATDHEMENKFKVVLGAGGPKEYYFRLCKIVKKHFSDFSPAGYDDWAEEQSSERIQDADAKLKKLNILVQKTIFDTFKIKYGEENDAYWNKGVPDKKIKTRAYEKSLDDEDDVRLPLENYLDFIEYKKIVEHKSNWPDFKPLFDIPDPGEKKYSKNIQWMTRVNELRRIPAHATEKRHYKLTDYDYIDYIYEEFTDRLNTIKANNDERMR